MSRSRLLAGALPEPEQESLERLLELHDIDPDRWAETHWLSLWAEAFAVPAVADRIQVQERCSRESAVIGACFRLRVNPDTWMRRMREARR